ncbi:hypothetical protein BpHYR1_012143 [Brachionus plicatilis]|uniref:RNA-directed DNA polymerase from mobile element jockey-like n=1 Tax=Brachionus plicatilis TaxID=10195 RepID=A0A3M7R8H8_BRAPC|nr:hypothetical protein BpHYR1_012143 [Brachionus plicatilis]
MIQTNILNVTKDKINTSDFLAFEFEIQFNLQMKIKSKNPPAIKKPNWNYMDFRRIYENKQTIADEHKSKIELTKLINNLNSIMRSSITDDCHSKKRNKIKKHLKTNAWWDNELTEMSKQAKMHIRNLET